MFRSPHTLPLFTLISAFVLATGAALFMSVQSAHAEVTGPCVASIAGVNVAGVNSDNRSDDIHVSQDQTVAVGAVSPVGFESHKIQLEFGSQRWTVSEENDDGSGSWSGSVNVDDYATWGVGLYKVIGVSTLSDGSTCEGAATVDVGGNPLTTVAGGIAAGAAVVGTIGALASGAAAATRNPDPLAFFGAPTWEPPTSTSLKPEEQEGSRRDEEGVQMPGWKPSKPPELTAGMLHPVEQIFGCVCFAAIALVMTPLMALTGGGAGVGPGEPAEPAQPTVGGEKQRRLPRAPWRPRITLLGLVSGLVAGGGVVVLLQQYSIQYPTLGAIITWVLIGMLVYGIVLPTLGYTFGWWRMNARISRLEKELR